MTTQRPRLNRYRVANDKLRQPGNVVDGVGFRSEVLRTSATRRTGLASIPAVRKDNPVFAITLIVALFIPFNSHFGSLSLNPYRLVLVVLAVPLFLRWMTGGGGKIRIADLSLLGFCLWIAPAMIVNHGIGQSWQFIAITVVETFVPFLIGRVAVRGAASFHKSLWVLKICFAAILPLVVIEALTGQRLISAAFGGPRLAEEMRIGLFRSAGPFEHPILAGVLAASCFAMCFTARKWSGKAIRGSALISASVVFFSLSLGAYITFLLQAGLLIFDRLTVAFKARWAALTIGIVFVFVALSLLSNRGPILIFIQAFSFNEFASAVRLQTWKFGTAVVLGNPLFGNGLNDWPRPSWLTSSVDNFWLLNAMRYGIPGFLFMAGAFFATIIPLMRSTYTDPRVAECRKNFIISIAAIMITACTVHFWGTIYVFVMFMLGAGSWMLQAAEPGRTSHRADQRVRQKVESASRTSVPEL